MKASTRFIHSIVDKLRIEELFFLLQSFHPLFGMFIPAHHEYTSGEIREVERSGVKYKLQVNDYMQWCIFADVSDKSWVEAKKILKENFAVLEICANSGAFCLKLGWFVYKSALKKIKVPAFEPNPFVSAVLKENLKLKNSLLNEIVLINEIGLGK